MQNALAALMQVTPSDRSGPIYPDNPSVWHHMSDALHQSLYRVLSLLIAILPGILAFFVALAVFTAIGMLISAILRRALAWTKFDEYVARTRGNADWTPATSPSALIARGSFWICVLLGLIIGVSAFDASYASATTLPISLLPYLTHAVGGIFLARSVLIGAVNAQLQYARFLSLGVKWLVLVLTAAMVLDHLEIGGVVAELAFGILFGGIVLTLSLAIGLGSRDLVSRSLESHSDRAVEHGTIPPEDPPASSADSIRHF